MNQNDFFEAMRTLDEEPVLQAMEHKKKNKIGAWAWGALAACLMLVSGIIWGPTVINAGGTSTDSDLMPNENPRAAAGIDSFKFDAYPIVDYEVSENFLETTKDLYILGVKCDNPIYQRVVADMEKYIKNPGTGLATFI